MSKTTGLVGALGAFGALAYLLAPLPPETPSAGMSLSPSPKVAASAPVESGYAATVVPVAAEEPAAPRVDAGVRLVQQIQSELLRLGCYGGAVDGRWSLETQQAMQALGERVRILRPVETPDYIMLALARSQTSHVCTARDRETASRQPARIVPMAAPAEFTPERAATPPARRPSGRAAAAPEMPRVRSGTRTANQPIESRNVSAAQPYRAAERAADQADDDDSVLPLSQDVISQDRMGLGAAPVDPLRAGIDPRDPTAPAVLRGPHTARAGSIVGDLGQPSPSTVLPDQAGHAARTTPPEATPRRSARRDWKRNFFAHMREAGP